VEFADKKIISATQYHNIENSFHYTKREHMKQAHTAPVDKIFE